MVLKPCTMIGCPDRQRGAFSPSNSPRRLDVHVLSFLPCSVLLQVLCLP